MKDERIKDSLRAIFNEFREDVESKKEPISVLIERYVDRTFRLFVDTFSQK